MKFLTATTIIGLMLVLIGSWFLNPAITIVLLGLILLSSVGLKVIIHSVWNGIFEILEDSNDRNDRNVVNDD